MSRKKGRTQVGVALFPFLAVLICTMGALIVLLVLLVQQARIDASVVAGAAIGGEAAKQLSERLEDAEWKRGLLEKSRAEKTAELADVRARLAHVEEHAQRLAARAQELLAQARAIDEGKQPADDLAAARKEIARLKDAIARREKELEEAKKKQRDAKESYALIPYEGAAGTRRRPIYVECTEFGVIVQPEGILLRSEDFSGPLGPGNPLDVTLRAIREHHERTLGPQAGQPYPLLVVRPGGILAYGAARAAMAAWDDEFGYELISEEKQLDFGEADPALASSLSRTVAVARQRQAAMAAMMPRKYQDEPAPSYGSSSPANSAAEGSASKGFGGGAGAATAGGGIGGGGTPGSMPYGSVGGGAGGGGSDRFGKAGSGSASGSPGAGGGEPSWPGAPTSAGLAGGAAGGGASGGAGAGGSAGSMSGAAAGGSSGAMNGGPATATSMSGGPAIGGGSAGGQPPAGQTAAGGMGPAGGALSASPQSGGQPSLSLPTFGHKSSPSTAAAGGSSTGSKAGGRGNAKTGKNWALPQAKPNSIGVTRPIRIAVLPDRIVLAPEQGDRRQGQMVPIAPELTPDDVTHFVDAVHREVDQWGLAVADGYWKPVLQAEVAPGGERHYENLRTALNGSGLDIIRR